MTTDSLILGRYRLDREIAVGGTARVWRARDAKQDRAVAVKLLHPHLLPDATSRRRLEGEARAAEALSHPAIAAVYDVSGPDDDPALVMELVDGEPLSRRLERDGPMPPRAAAALAADVAEALYHAHQRGIVHRDVKPANILVERRSGRARLIDFGIAHSLEAASQDLTRTGTSLGTPRYMAPEQLAGEPVGPRTDLWGLGAVLYQALSGRVPFDGATPLAIADPAAGRRAAAGRGSGAGGAGDALPVGRHRRSPDPCGRGGPGAASVDRRRPGCRAGHGPAPPRCRRLRRSPSRLFHDRHCRSATSAARRRISPMAAVAGGLLLVVALAGVGLALGGGLPDARTAGSVGDAVCDFTPAPTPNWRAPLLAAYLEACGEPLDRSELQGLTRARG